jgi:hypothetical protein
VGLLAYLPHTWIRLEGTLAGIGPAAWHVLETLGVVLDGTGMIRNLRGQIRGRYEREGWAAVPGLRRASGSYRTDPPGPGTNPPEGMGNR